MMNVDGFSPQSHRLSDRNTTKYRPIWPSTTRQQGYRMPVYPKLPESDTTVGYLLESTIFPFEYFVVKMLRVFVCVFMCG